MYASEELLKVLSLDLDSVIGISDGLDLVVISDNEVLVQFGTRSYPSELLRDTDLKGFLGKVIGLLQESPKTLNVLLTSLPEEHRAEAQTLVVELIQAGILSDPRVSPVGQYLRYTFDGESSLSQITVSVIGAGPLGARVAYGLAQHGVGRVKLLDDRKVDRLWYTYLPFGLADSQDEGPAHAVLGKLLNRAGKSLSYFDADLSAAGVEAAVAESDFTVVAFDQPNISLTHLVNRFCIRDRKPWIVTTIDGNFGLIGPLFLPPDTACYNDYWTLASANIPNAEMARKYRQYLRGRESGLFFPGLPSYAEIAAGYTTLAIVHFLLRENSFALGRVMSINFERMLIDVEDVLKLPRCPVCGGDRSAYRPPFPADVVTAT